MAPQIDDSISMLCDAPQQAEERSSRYSVEAFGEIDHQSAFVVSKDVSSLDLQCNLEERVSRLRVLESTSRCGTCDAIVPRQKVLGSANGPHSVEHHEHRDGP